MPSSVSLFIPLFFATALLSLAQAARVAIVGGGIGGAFTAHNLREHNCSIEV